VSGTGRRCSWSGKVESVGHGFVVVVAVVFVGGFVISCRGAA
jgi:hypothetical protein